MNKPPTDNINLFKLMKNPPSDKQLRSRVKLFGNLLGNVLKQQAGGRVLSSVETLRKGHINLRKKDNPQKRKRLDQIVSVLDPDTLDNVVRAFSTYFSLINIVEESYQHRQRRRKVRAGGPLWPGSFDAALRGFKKKGINAEQLQLLLNKLVYTPVFTAHPTESKRRTIMESLRRIFLVAEGLDDPRLNKTGRAELTDKLESQIQTLWKTDEVRRARPQVKDEISNGLFYFRESLFSAVPTVYRNMENAVNRIYKPEDNATSELPLSSRLQYPGLLRFAVTIGGNWDDPANVHLSHALNALHIASTDT